MNKEKLEAKLRNNEDSEKVYAGSSCRLLEMTGRCIRIYFSTNTNSIKERDFIPLCLDEAEYLSCKLNQMITELKRKENSCS